MEYNNKILEISGLTLNISGKHVVDNVGFSLSRGEILALVGESGSGKTLTGLSILGLVPKFCVREKGEVNFRGKNIFDLKEKEIRHFRGKHIAMVFQEPLSRLNPVMRVGTQIGEAVIVHKVCQKNKVQDRVKWLLELVKLSPEIAYNYPHELSGGTRQRVMLSMAISCGPEILILDEPTTALDVSTQKEMLDLVKNLQTKERFAVLFITHDFSIVNRIADRVSVMREGSIVESGTKQEILTSPKHPYTRRLIECIVRLGDERERLPE